MYLLATRLPTLGRFLKGFVVLLRCLFTLTEINQVVFLVNVFEAHFLRERLGGLKARIDIARALLFSFSAFC